MKLFRVKKSKIFGGRTYIFEGCLRVNIILFNSLGKEEKVKRTGEQPISAMAHFLFP